MDEVFAGPAEPLAPDITLELTDGGLVSILSSDEVFRPRDVPIGAHRPEGVFLARGPGMRKGERLPELSILDVAPMILYGLGLPVPDELEGRVPEQAYETEAWKSGPVVKGTAASRPPAAAPSRKRGDAKLSKDDEKRLAAHLRALGYIE